MVAAVSRSLRNKFLGNKKLLRCVSVNSTKNLRFSSQTQPSILDDGDEGLKMKLDPLVHPDYFQVHKMFTVKDLFDARVHYGHKEGSLDNRMKQFLYGSRLGHVIFDLDQTAELLREALNFTAHVAYNNGIILFVSRSSQTTHLVEKTAKECQEFSQTRKWKGGTFTNSSKEFGAITRLPDLCIVFNTLNDIMTEHRVVSNAAKMCIPIVGIVDSNCNPNLVTYPVPGNDDSPSAIELYCNLFKKAILSGKVGRQSIHQQNNI